MAERHRRNERSELQPRGVAGQPGERRPTLERVPEWPAGIGKMVRPIQTNEPRILGDAGDRLPPVPVEAILAFEHQRDLNHPGSPSESVLTDRVTVPLVAATAQ